MRRVPALTVVAYIVTIDHHIVVTFGPFMFMVHAKRVQQLVHTHGHL
jgi:hypothetical protein